MSDLFVAEGNKRRGFLLPAAVLVSLALHFSAIVLLLPSVSNAAPPPELDYLVVETQSQYVAPAPAPAESPSYAPESSKEEPGPRIEEPQSEPAETPPAEPPSESPSPPPSESPVEQQALSEADLTEEVTSLPETAGTMPEETPDENGAVSMLAPQGATQIPGGSFLPGGNSRAGAPEGNAGASSGAAGGSAGAAGGSAGGSGGGTPYGSGTSRPPYLPEERHFIPFYQVDQKPQMIEKAALGYPVQAKRRNLEGTVIVEADIDETGRIVNVRVVKEAGFGFDEAATEYVKESRFSPAYVGKKPVAVRMRFTVTFSLKD